MPRSTKWRPNQHPLNEYAHHQELFDSQLHCVASCFIIIVQSNFLCCGNVLPDFLLWTIVCLDGVGCLDCLNCRICVISRLGTVIVALSIARCDGIEIMLRIIAATGKVEAMRKVSFHEMLRASSSDASEPNISKIRKPKD
jgi:hypothetical protein